MLDTQSMTVNSQCDYCGIPTRKHNEVDYIPRSNTLIIVAVSSPYTELTSAIEYIPHWCPVREYEMSIKVDCPECGKNVGYGCINLAKLKKGVEEQIKNPHTRRLLNARKAQLNGR